MIIFETHGEMFCTLHGYLHMLCAGAGQSVSTVQCNVAGSCE